MATHKNIIFLDIDGVLNLIPQGHDDHGPIFHPHLVENLRELIEATDAKIVISSTWRADGLEAMQYMWEGRDYPGEVIDITPLRSRNGKERGYQIQDWIDFYKPENYVILDDDSDMLPNQMNNFVKTSENFDHTDYIDAGYGLTKECTKKAIAIFS